MDKKKCNSCGEAPHKCSCKNKEFTKAVVEINNPEQITLMRKVVIPASMGDDTTVPPTIGKYHNVLLYYEANSKSYLYSSDGIPTQLVNGFTNYEEAINLPQVNGVTLLGDKSSADLKLADAPMVITVANGNTHWSGADTAEEVYDFFLNKGKVNVVFSGGENYAYEIASAGYIENEGKLLCVVVAASTQVTGGVTDFDGNALFGTMTLYTAGKAVDVSQIELQPKLFVTDFTGLDLYYNELSGVPATNASIGMVKPGDGLEVDTDGTLSISDIEQYAHFFDTVADMKAATNLVDGDYARTGGFYAVNDGGNALYKVRNITNDDVIDEMLIIELADDTLVAELIDNKICPEMIGAYADGTHDDITYLDKLINVMNTKNIYFNAKTYAISSTLEINLSEAVALDFSGATLKALYDISMVKIDSGTLGNSQNGFIKNLTLDMNEIASVGLDIYYSWRIIYDTISIRNIGIGGIGIWVSGRKYGTNKSGGNLFTNIRGFGTSTYTSSSEYNTFIIIDTPDNTFNNVDYSKIKRGIDVNGFTTLSNVHGFVNTELMYIESYFCKINSPLIFTNAYPDTQQFGFILVGNKPVTITNTIFTFNKDIITSDITALHPTHGIVTTTSGGAGKLVHFIGVVVSTDAQELTLSSTTTIEGTTYYAPRVILRDITTQYSDNTFSDQTMRLLAVSSANWTMNNSASDGKRVTARFTINNGITNITTIASWNSIYYNYKIPDGFYPVTIKDGSTLSTGYVEVNSNAIKLQPSVAADSVLYLDLPVINAQ